MSTYLDELQLKLIDAENERNRLRLISAGLANKNENLDYVMVEHITDCLVKISRPTIYEMIEKNLFPPKSRTINRRSIWTLQSISVFLLVERKVLKPDALAPFLKGAAA